MKNLFAICLLFLAFSNFAFGYLLYTPLDKSVKDSDFIVIGTLQTVFKTDTEEFETLKGILIVEKVIAGNIRTEKGFVLKAGDKIEVGWKNSKMTSCRFIIDDYSEGIWLLQLNYDGTTKPLFPGALVSKNELTDVNKHLKKLNRTNETAKIVKIQNDSEINSNSENPVDNNPKTSFGIYSIEQKMNHYLISSFLVILASISLYYLLYRSRFKIR